MSWKGLKASSRFHNFILFLGFVVLATFFWIIMAMNDSAQDSFDVRLSIANVPDSITFITDPPQKIHITVRDKGTRIFRASLNDPKLSLNFREYASGGILRFTPADLNASLKALFGPSAQITSSSLDSLNLSYTTEPGKKVPVIICADVKAASGKIISGKITASQSSVLLYSTTVNLDTVTKVYTKNVIRRNLNEDTKIKVQIQPIAGVKIVPSTITVSIPVEPLVKKTVMVPITVKDARPGYSLLLFPDNVEVTCYVPMSKFNHNIEGITVNVSFNDAINAHSTKVPLTIGSYPATITTPSLKYDSVEYTIVK